MTRVLSEGFEMQDLVALTYSSDVAINTSIKRSGSASLRILGGEKYFSTPLSDLSEFYVRFGIYCAGNNTNRIFSLVWMHGSTILGTLVINFTTNGFIQLNVGGTIYSGTQVAIGTYPLLESKWYSVELHVKIGDNPDGVLSSKFEGISDADFPSGDTKPDANTHADTLRFYNVSYGGLSASTYIYIDDIGINSVAGAADNSWLGDGKIIVIKPTGDTATLELTPSAALDHYTLVDDIPADGDTTYVEGSVDDERDIYDLAACGLTDVIITRIWTEARAKDTGVSGKAVALITKASGGAEVSGGDVVLAGGYTVKVKGAEQLVNPVDSAAWEVADIDALQGGPKTRP